MSATHTTNSATKDAYIAKMKLQLDELNEKMEELESRAHEAKLEAQEKYKEEMAKLRAQSKLALDKLGELKSATESNWQELVTNTEKVRDAFVSSFHYFKSQF
jgi:ATP/maltotriose-dependent transcriptional regulator MalT